MNSSSDAEPASVPVDVCAFADEAGARGLLRDLTPTSDHEVGVLCTLPIPAEHVEAVRKSITPLFVRFAEAAPQGATLHITEAFAPGNEEWAKVAVQVRDELFAMMREKRIISIYVARRSRLARQTFGAQRTLVESAKAAKRSHIKTGADRPSDQRIEDQLMIDVALMLDAFAEREGRKRVDIMFDQIDAQIASRYEKALEITRNVSKVRKTVKGWDPDKKEKVARELEITAGAPFPLDSRFLGQITVVGKNDPLVFAADVVANSLWRHLMTLAPDAKLNGPNSVSGWHLGELVWGKNADKGFDSL